MVLERIFDSNHTCMSNNLQVYHAKNPFSFMEAISLTGKTNFFEKRVGEYSKSGVTSKQSEQVFSLDVDF